MKSDNRPIIDRKVDGLLLTERGAEGCWKMMRYAAAMAERPTGRDEMRM